MDLSFFLVPELLRDAALGIPRTDGGHDDFDHIRGECCSFREPAKTKENRTKADQDIKHGPTPHWTETGLLQLYPSPRTHPIGRLSTPRSK